MDQGRDRRESHTHPARSWLAYSRNECLDTSRRPYSAGALGCQTSDHLALVSWLASVDRNSQTDQGRDKRESHVHPAEDGLYTPVMSVSEPVVGDDE